MNNAPVGPVQGSIASLPLALRVPNPPVPFVGRAAQVRAVEAALVRGPVVVLSGEAGIGKSALVAAVVQRLAPPTVVRVSLRDHGEPPALTVARALFRLEARGVELGVALDDDALSALCLDLAETHAAFVVLEDAHAAPFAAVDALLSCFSAFARRAKLLTATRATRAPLGIPRVVLGPLTARDLERLEAGGEGDLAARARALAAAAGNPGVFLQALAAGGPDEPRSPAADATLSVLAALAGPVPVEVLERLAPGAGLTELVQARLVDRDGGVARLLAPRPSVPEPPGLVDALTATDWPEGLLWCARVLLSRAPSEAVTLLTERADELLGRGYAHAVVTLLDGRVEPALVRLRLRCAVLLGDTRALAREPSLGDDDEEAVLLRARLLLQDDRPLDARALLEAWAPRVPEAALLSGQASLRLGDYASAERAFADPRFEGALAVRRDALAAGLAALLRRPDDALARVAAVRAALPSLPEAERPALSRSLAQAVYFLGHLDLARALVDEALASPAASIRTETGRLLQFLRATLALEGGQLDVARAELDRLAPWASERSAQAPWIRLAQGHLDLADGDLAGVLRRLDALAADPVMAERQREVAYLRRLVDLERAHPFEPAGPDGDTVFGRLHALTVARHAARSLGEAPAVDLDEPHAELRILARVAAAEHALAEGDAARALIAAQGALADARASGFGLHAAEALVLRGDALVLLGRSDAVAETAAELAGFAASAPSAAFGAHAAWFSAVATARDPSPLEPLVGGDARAARRAAAVLGDEVALDLVDRRVVAAARATGLGPGRVVGAGEPWGYHRGRVWDARGSIDLAPHPTPHRLLRALLERSEADKEALVIAVWGERDYHPLRHDNRLQATMHKLRRLLGDEGPVARRIRTTDAGYALVGRVRVGDVSPDGSP